MRVLVTGGTGVLGREVAARLRQRGVEVRVLTRHPGPEPDQVRGDLESGEGLAEALAGADAVAHCASAGDVRHPRRDLAQTRNLLDAAAATRPHIVYISIVGADQVRFGLYRAKLACERMVAASGLPWTVLRATQFHDLILMLAISLTKLPVALVPRGVRSQPVDVGEVADCLVELLLGPAAGRVPDMGGPRVEDIAEATRAYLAATGRRRPVVRIPLLGRAMADFRAGNHLLGPGGVRGRRTFADYLKSRVGADRRVAAPYDLQARARR